MVITFYVSDMHTHTRLMRVFEKAMRLHFCLLSDFCTCVRNSQPQPFHMCLCAFVNKGGTSRGIRLGTTPSFLLRVLQNVTNLFRDHMNLEIASTYAPNVRDRTAPILRSRWVSFHGMAQDVRY